jgi:hypothetical protein
MRRLRRAGETFTAEAAKFSEQKKNFFSSVEN